MSNKLIGKLYEKRGEDILRVYTSESGDVVQIDQHFEGSAFRVISVDFWKETAPELVKLIQEAAGIEPEYEYAIQRTRVNPVETSTIAGDVWGPCEEVNMRLLDLTTGSVEYTLVRRRKAGPVEVVDA